MRNVNYQRSFDWDAEEQPTNQIIYLDAHRKPASQRKSSKGDVFWNAFFAFSCLSVLVVLFLH